MHLTDRLGGKEAWRPPHFSLYQTFFAFSKRTLLCTAIPYRASTGPEQGFPCVVFPHREKPVFIAGFPVDENRFFPVGNTTQGKPCFHYRDGFAVYVHIPSELGCCKKISSISWVGMSDRVHSRFFV